MVVSIVISGFAVIPLAATTLNVFQRRERPNGRSLVGLLSGLTLWAVLLIAAQIATTVSFQPAADVFKLANVVPVFTVPPMWTTYVLGYAGRKTGFTRRRILMVAAASLPILLTGGILTIIAINPAESIGGPLILGLLVLLFLSFLYPIFVIGYGSVVLIRLGQKHTALSSTQIFILLCAIIAPYLGFLTEWDNPVGGGVSVGLLAAGLMFSIAIRRYPLLSRFPESESVARTRVVESLQEPVVVLNWEEKVLDVNKSLTRLVDGSAESLIGTSITSIIDEIDREDLQAGTTAMTTLNTINGRRKFQYSVSPIDASGQTDDSGEKPVSRAVVFRDVTDEQTQQQRLKVLNRILRHNVRNRLDVVLAHAEQIDAETPRQQVRENATDLVELSEKAREAEEIMEVSTEPPETVDIVSIAERVTDERAAAWPTAEITLTTMEELTITSHPIIVEELLSELVDNAVEHAEKPTPKVSICVEQVNDSVVKLVVADNGPGIPDQEQAVLNEETEEPLKHSKGIGLWFVKWAVSRLGGELTIEQDDPHGSMVTAYIRDLAFESAKKDHS